MATASLAWVHSAGSLLRMKQTDRCTRIGIAVLVRGPQPRPDMKGSELACGALWAELVLSSKSVFS